MMPKKLFHSFPEKIQESTHFLICHDGAVFSTRCRLWTSLQLLILQCVSDLNGRACKCSIGCRDYGNFDDRIGLNLYRLSNFSIFKLKILNFNGKYFLFLSRSFTFRAWFPCHFISKIRATKLCLLLEYWTW